MSPAHWGVSSGPDTTPCRLETVHRVEVYISGLEEWWVFLYFCQVLTDFLSRRETEVEDSCLKLYKVTSPDRSTGFGPLRTVPEMSLFTGYRS